MLKPSRKPIKGILVLAGLFDPCGDLGTQCRYDLLPIPWEKHEFRKHVSNIIRVERTSLEVNDIGLKAWIETGQNYHALSNLLVQGWSDERGHLAGLIIDNLSFHAQSIDYHWSYNEYDDEKGVGEFEKLLLKQLEGYD